jgi:hypothetical protein
LTTLREFAKLTVSTSQAAGEKRTRRGFRVFSIVGAGIKR